MKNAIKIISIVIILAITSVNLKAQNNAGKTDDLGRIVLNTYVSDQIEGLPSMAKRMLSSKLSQIATRNGLGGNSLNPRFIITPNVTVLTKEMTPTAPPMTALTLDISFYIGDGIAGTKFSSTSLQVKGVGTNETKAYISALKRIRSTNPMLKNFINEGKSKIIEYYNSKCDFIIQDALSKSGMKKYDEGISSLLGVPEVCKECYNKSQDVAVSIYKKKMENECMERIQESKVAITNKNWDKAANLLGSILPDVSCYDESQTILKEIEDHRCSDALGKAQGAWSAMDAEQAGHWLSQISADSKCAEDANALGKEIKTKLKEDEDKEWDFKLKKQQDEVDVAKLSIEATREVGVAFGENSNLTTYNVKGWW